jgi:hypothetical protein
MEGFMLFETGAGIEPAHGSFANYSVSTSPPGQDNYSITI